MIAGLTVGVMAVPQVVSFAAMAGVPAQLGLYGCFAPVIAYALFGGSPHLVSLWLGIMIAAASDNFNAQGSTNMQSLI